MAQRGRSLCPECGAHRLNYETHAMHSRRTARAGLKGVPVFTRGAGLVAEGMRSFGDRLDPRRTHQFGRGLNAERSTFGGSVIRKES